MNVVDSSGWLEYFAEGPNTGFFADPIEDVGQLLVSAINLFEVVKRMEQQYDTEKVTRNLNAMRRGAVIPLDEPLALLAVELAIKHKLPLADSIILATAYAFEATLWTQDAHFAGIEGVEYIPKP